MGFDNLEWMLREEWMEGVATQIHRRRSSWSEDRGGRIAPVTLRLKERCQTVSNLLVYPHYILLTLKQKQENCPQDYKP